MRQVQIELLRSGHEKLLLNCAPQVFDDPIDLDSTRKFLQDPRHHVAVAIDEGLVVGFVSAVDYFHPDKTSPELWINEVAVAPTHRTRGIAKNLLDALLGAARELGCSEAWVLTDRSNAAAMKLYASVGGIEGLKDQVMFTFPLQIDDSPEP